MSKSSKALNAFHLKIVAIIAMFINHIGHTFENVFNPPVWNFIYLAIGLLTFPIMAYLLVEGFHYTHSKWRYVGRLAIFWLISIIPFEALFKPGFPLPYFDNIMFTLMMGVLMMMALEKVKQPVLRKLLLPIFAMLTIFSDWQVFGILIIWGFYRNYQKPDGIRKVILPIFLAFGIIFGSALLLSPSLDNWSSFLAQFGILLTIPLLESYNGQRGYSPSWVKWGFYAFYPLHISLLWLLRFLILGQ